MLTSSPKIDRAIYQVLFSAALGYLAVAVLILRPTNSFGLVHTAWAIFCSIGAGLAFKAAKKREEEWAGRESLAQRLADVEEARRKGLISEDEYLTKRAQLIANA